jgi:hypothetical protein
MARQLTSAHAPGSPQPTTARVDLHSLAQAHFDRAKWLWWVALILKGVAALISILALFIVSAAQFGYIAVALFVLASEFFQLYSDRSRGKSEGMRRELDFADSFGTPVSKQSVADLQAETSTRLLGKLPAEGKAVSYFASTEPPGASRALENVLESSWWSRRLAETMVIVYGAVTIIVVALAIALLVGTLAFAVPTTNTASVDSLARLGMFVVVLISSLGLIRQLTGYSRFKDSAFRVEETAEQMIRTNNSDLLEITKLWQRYHIARAASPLLPSLLWQTQRNKLNRLWNEYRKPGANNP